MQNVVTLLLLLPLMKPYTHTRGHIGFKQYNPNKLTKYGLLYHSLCDASVSYTYYSLPYVGKPEDLSGDASKYYILGTNEYTKYLVNEKFLDTTQFKDVIYQ